MLLKSAAVDGVNTYFVRVEVEHELIVEHLNEGHVIIDIN